MTRQKTEKGSLGLARLALLLWSLVWISISSPLIFEFPAWSGYENYFLQDFLKYSLIW